MTFSGAVPISDGKDDKSRKTYAVQKSRKALKKFLKHRTNHNSASRVYINREQKLQLSNCYIFMGSDGHLL